MAKAGESTEHMLVSGSESAIQMDEGKAWQGGMWGGQAGYSGRGGNPSLDAVLGFSSKFGFVPQRTEHGPKENVPLRPPMPRKVAPWPFVLLKR